MILYVWLVPSGMRCWTLAGRFKAAQSDDGLFKFPEDDSDALLILLSAVYLLMSQER